MRKSLLPRVVLIMVLISTMVPTLSADVAADEVCTHGSLGEVCTGNRYCRYGDDPLGCYPAPPVQPPINCNERNFGLRPPATVRGSVRGPGGAGVKDACVYWKASWGWASTHSDAQGLFAIDVAADSSSTVIYVAKPYMTWTSSEVVPLEYLSDPAKRLDLSIAFTNQAYIKPWAINSSSGRELLVELYSAAPTQTVRSLIEFEGLTVDLTHDPTYGLSAFGMHVSRWKGSLHTASGLPEGVRRYETCLLSSGSTGGCGSSDGIIYSPVPPEPLRALLAVDNTPPTAKSSSPLPLHNTVDDTPEIRVIPEDSLSGVDWNRGHIALDGVALASALWGTPSAPLSIGVHSVTATIWDLAGNSSEVSWQFAVTTLKGGPAKATVTPKTVNIAPPPPAMPPLCCAYVQFGEIDTNLSGYDLEFGGSPLWAGTGSIVRYVQHKNLKVTFKSAAQEITIDIPYYSSAMNSEIAALEPTADLLRVTLPATKFKMHGLGVTVPPEFVITQDSTATVWADEENIPTSTVQPYLDADPLPQAIPSGIDPPVVNVTKQSGYRIQEQDGVLVLSGLQGSITASTTVQTVDRSVLLTAISDPRNNAFANSPIIKCNGTDQPELKNIPCLGTGAPLAQNFSWLSFSRESGGVGLYSNRWLFRDNLEPLFNDSVTTYMAWSQLAAEVKTTCRQGTLIKPRITSMSTEIRQVVSDPRNQEPAWSMRMVHSENPVAGTVGTRTETKELIWGDLGSLDNSIRNTATFSNAAKVVGTGVSELAGTVSGGVTWTHSPGIEDSNEKIIFGSAFDAATSESLPIEIWTNDIWWVEFGTRQGC